MGPSKLGGLFAEVSSASLQWIHKNPWLLQEVTEAAGVADRKASSEGNEADKKSNGAQQAAAPRRLGKDPTAQTDFLPDHEREAQEIAVREQLKKEYELRQKVRNACKTMLLSLSALCQSCGSQRAEQRSGSDFHCWCPLVVRQFPVAPKCWSELWL